MWQVCVKTASVCFCAGSWPQTCCVAYSFNVFLFSQFKPSRNSTCYAIESMMTGRKVTKSDIKFYWPSDYVAAAILLVPLDELDCRRMDDCRQLNRVNVYRKSLGWLLLICNLSWRGLKFKMLRLYTGLWGGLGVVRGLGTWENRLWNHSHQIMFISLFNSRFIDDFHNKKVQKIFIIPKVNNFFITFPGTLSNVATNGELLKSYYTMMKINIFDFIALIFRRNFLWIKNEFLC